MGDRIAGSSIAGNTEANWKIGDAKQRLSEVVRAADEQPQRIYNRDRLVAAIVGPDDLAIIERHHSESRRSLADVFAEAALLAQQKDDYRLDIPVRKDRPNPLLSVLDAYGRGDEHGPDDEDSRDDA